MKILSGLGLLLLAAGGIAAWVALLGIWVPSLDTYASFLPLFAAPILVGTALAWRSGRWAPIAALIGIAPVAFGVAPELLRTIPASPAGAPQIRIATHNVWVHNRDPAGTAQVILAAKPDIVLLQEVEGNFRRMLPALRSQFPYATDCPRACSLVILSRWPIGARGYRFRDAAGRQLMPGLAWATIQPPGQPAFTVATLHYPHPSPEQTQMRQELASTLRQIDTRRLILAGDMNLTPWAAAMREQDKDFAPLVRMTRALPSWRRPLPLLPIDHLYAGPGWGLAEAQRLPATGSDHYPLLISLGRQ